MLVTYKEHVTRKLRDEVTDSAAVVTASADVVTRSPAIYGCNPYRWEEDPDPYPDPNPPQTKDKNQRLADDYTRNRQDGFVKQAPADAPVMIRFRFWDGSETPKIIEKELRPGNSKKNRWVMVVDVVGLTDNGGLTFSGSIIGKWVTENSNPPISPVSPIPLRLFPVRPPEPPKLELLPNIPPPPLPPPPPPPPATFKPTTSYTPKNPVVPFLICYDCFAGSKTDHVDRDAANIDNWLKANPDYKLVVYVDANAKNGSSWNSIVGGKTVNQILNERYAHFFSDLVCRFSYMASRIILNKRNPTGRTITLLPERI